MEVKYPFHEHPLTFKEEQKDEEVHVCCYGCKQPILGPTPSYYGCTPCEIFLHKLCAELPHKMSHPMHPQHPLTLLPYCDESLGNCCDSCGSSCDRFFYECFICHFSLDIPCLPVTDKIQQTIEHRSHEHPLISLQKPASFFCSACGTEHRGSSCLCTTCGFWINQKCASLPNTFKPDHHRHPLTLAYSLPDEYHQFTRFYDICTKELKRVCLVYYCAGCTYFSHVNCVTSKVELFRDGETEFEVDDLDSNLINLPLANDWVDPTIHFINGISQQGNYKKVAEISHISHEHPLIFVDKQIKYNGICNGCAKPISASFYHCAQCDFFLHEGCVELRDELQHPCHTEHPLFLIAHHTMDFHQRRCQCCEKYCNVFMLGCSLCEFYHDIECASLPYIIKHETHRHTLRIRKISSSKCSACGCSLRFMFACDACNFFLFYLCALLPSKFWHRFDEHPFLLTYSPLENHPGEYLCEICEEDVDPRDWFYHCADCDQSFIQIVSILVWLIFIQM